MARHLPQKSIAYFSITDIRRFLIEGIYRRLQGDEAAGYVMKGESVLRMGIAAAL